MSFHYALPLIVLYFTRRACSGFSQSWGLKRSDEYIKSRRIASKERANLKTTTTALHLVPFSEFSSSNSFLSSPKSNRVCLDPKGRLVSDDESSSNPYLLCLAEEDDLADVAKLVVDSFGATAINLSTELSSFERAFLDPPVGAWNAYTGAVAFAEVLSGLRMRMKRRLKRAMDLSPPSIPDSSEFKEKLDAAVESSLVLALARPKPEGQSGIVIIASVELLVQPCDAKIPFSFPWLDSLERKIANFLNIAPTAENLQPYLSSLCVLEEYRGKGVGKAMVRALETIVTENWGFSKLYLHVDVENKAAYQLYENQKFIDTNARWRPFWAGEASKIGYFEKTYG